MIKKILVSQPKPASEKSPYFEIQAKHDVEFVFHPFIKIEGLSSLEFRQQKIKILDYTAIVFNSRHAVDFFFTLCKELRVSLPEDMRYYALTEAISLYIQKYVVYRKRKAFFGKTGKYLGPLSDVHSDEVARTLDAKKLHHRECVMYRTVSNAFPDDLQLDCDMLVLFTPAGVESLLKNFPDFKQGEIAVATFGANTTKAARDAGLRIDIEVPRPEAPSMPAAIDIFMREQG